MKAKRHSFIKKSIALLLLSGTLAITAPIALADPLEISLDDSVAISLKNNPSIQVAVSGQDVASWQVNEAKIGFKPTVTYTFSGQRTGSPSSVAQSGMQAVNGTGGGLIGYTVPKTTYIPRSESDEFNNKFSLSVPLYTGGSLEGQLNEANLNLDVSKLNLELAKQTIRYQATSYYYSVLEAQNMVKVDQDSVNDLREHLKNVQAQYDVGTVAKSDVLQSQVNLANAEQTLIESENTYQIALTNLKNVMGLSMDTELKLKDSLRYVKYEINLDDAIQYALKHRPDKIQTDLQINIAKEKVNVADSGYRPTVTAGATTDWNDSHLLGTKNYNWTIGVTAQWNVFDSGMTKTKIAEANASVTEATHQAKQTNDSVILGVQQAYLNLKAAEKRIRTTQVTVDQGEENYRIAQVRYSAGVGTNVDVMDAETDLTTSKTNAVKALYDYNTSKAQLDQAMGMPVQ